MKKLLTLLVTFTAIAAAQYAPSASGSSTAAGEINGKLNVQFASGPPSGLNCTVGRDAYIDTSAIDFYVCSVTGTPGTWAKKNGVTGGTCTNQAATAISTSGVPTCTTLTSSYVNNTIALTGVDINTSNQVTATHLASALPVAQGGTGQTSGTVAFTIASGTSALGTGAISGNACATVVTTTATGTAATDAITWSPNADISGVTGYGILSTDGLKVYPYPTTNNVNWRVCNGTATSITPGAVTLNWRVVR